MSAITVIEEPVYESAARTATPTAVTLYTRGKQRLHLVIDVTAITSTPSVTPKIDGYDSLSNKWYNLLTGTAITETGTTVLKIGPGMAAQANASAQDMLPGRIRVTMTHADSDSATYTVAVHLGP